MTGRQGLDEGIMGTLCAMSTEFNKQEVKVLEIDNGDENPLNTTKMYT